jgi:DNA repair protein RecO (recombination protein O)
MSFVKVNGIVIREVNTGEADKIITIFSKSLGKISAIANGAKKTKSSMSAGTQFLCYCDFVLFKGRSMYSISSCEIIAPFYEIRNDIIKLTYAAHMADILEDVIQENQPASKLLQLFLNCLHMLTKQNRNPELVTRIFELRLLSIMGYMPYVHGCLECGGGEFGQMAFSFKKCGFLCTKNVCRSNDEYAMQLSVGAAKTIYFIVNAKLEEAFSFSVSDEVLEEISKVSKRYIKDRLDRNYNKLDMLRSLQ